MIEAVTDEGFFPNDRNPSQDTSPAERTLTVSVISLGDEVLVTMPVSGRSSVWELKGLIEKSIPGKHMQARWTTLMLGPQVLADAASLHHRRPVCVWATPNRVSEKHHVGEQIQA